MPVESMIRKLKVQYLKGQLAVSRNVCSSLAHEFETTGLTVDEKAAIAHRWDKALKESHGLQLALELLEKPARESKTNAAPARCQALGAPTLPTH